MKPTIGLTGGIASGKSTVAKVLAGRGVGVVDADALAREVVALGTDGLREIVRAFGSDVLELDGTLNRKRLGALVFEDASKRAVLNAITHPRIAALSAARIAEAQASASPYVIYEAALLVEGVLYRAMSALIVVTAAPALQTTRAGLRDGLTAAETSARIAAQLPIADKVAAADYVIENNGSLADLTTRTLDVHNKILQRFSLTS